MGAPAALPKHCRATRQARSVSTMLKLSQGGVLISQRFVAEAPIEWKEEHILALLPNVGNL